MRKPPVILLTLGLLAVTASLIFPWHQPQSPEEWDDGQHVWGQNVHGHSTWSFDFESPQNGDETAVQLRQAATAAFGLGIVLALASWLFSLRDRRAGTLGFGWPAWLVLGASGGALIGALMLDFTAAADLNPGIGLYTMGTGTVLLFIGNILAIWLGRSDREKARKAAKRELKAERRIARMEAGETGRSQSA